MEIKTQDVYLPVDIDKIKDTPYIPIISPNGLIINRFEADAKYLDKNYYKALEKHTGMVVMTKQEFEKAIGDAFDAGIDKAISDAIRTKDYLPDKATYIATIIK